MKNYRKKPIVIQAVQLTPSNFAECLAICEDFSASVKPTEDHGPGEILIPTLEGVMRASVGDWILRGVKGEFYPCKPDIFAATYDPA